MQLRTIILPAILMMLVGIMTLPAFAQEIASRKKLVKEQEKTQALQKAIAKTTQEKTQAQKKVKDLTTKVAKTQAQASGLGVFAANGLAALGGCWWPIEITPEWMQFVQKLLPTGWTMDALHKLISFQADAASVIPHIVMLLVAAAIFGLLATRRFRYE